jgi:hypothetical protein
MSKRLPKKPKEEKEEVYTPAEVRIVWYAVMIIDGAFRALIPAAIILLFLYASNQTISVSMTILLWASAFLSFIFDASSMVLESDEEEYDEE